MNIEGAWQVEMLGPYGWESISTAFMQGGRYLASGVNHYSIGSYSETDGVLEVRTRITQHGQSRTIFGEAKKKLDLHIEGAIDKDGTILGKACPSGRPNFEVKFRMTRLGDID